MWRQREFREKRRDCVVIVKILDFPGFFPVMLAKKTLFSLPTQKGALLMTCTVCKKVACYEVCAPINQPKTLARVMHMNTLIQLQEIHFLQNTENTRNIKIQFAKKSGVIGGVCAPINKSKTVG